MLKHIWLSIAIVAAAFCFQSESQAAEHPNQSVVVTQWRTWTDKQGTHYQPYQSRATAYWYASSQELDGLMRPASPTP